MAEGTGIREVTGNAALDIALDTIAIGKQALVFVNTKKGAEASAEKIAEETKDISLDELSEEILHVLSSPTKQCKRLAKCVRRGVAFHHSGLPSKQRALIESSFISGKIKVICATPTLAYGINMPAFRAIIKDLKRYGGRWGMQWIPTLEYQQMIGRAGRPDFNDKFGEAICIASTESERDEITKRFLLGDPEKIYSKLAVEPVLRTSVLGLISTGFAGSKKELMDFFSETLYGYQFKGYNEIEPILTRIIRSLEEWEFVKTEGGGGDDFGDFVSASSMGDMKVKATPLGERVSELYIDPFTAHYIITSLRRAMQKNADEFSFLQMASGTLEVRPPFKTRVSEIQEIEEKLVEKSSDLIVIEPSIYDPEYEDFLDSIKTAIVFSDWMDEKNEDYILETYNVTPGEFNSKLDLADWVLYSAEELASLMHLNDQVRLIRKTRMRLQHGIKEELVPLVRLRNIGRVRARKLYDNRIKDIGDVKDADLTTLSQIIGKSVALDIKKQVGEEVVEVPERRRKGQKNVKDFLDE